MWGGYAGKRGSKSSIDREGRCDGGGGKKEEGRDAERLI
jgi:hypothetical protein